VRLLGLCRGLSGRLASKVLGRNLAASRLPSPLLGAGHGSGSSSSSGGGGGGVEGG
jgi:hypothetical protein